MPLTGPSTIRLLGRDLELMGLEDMALFGEEIHSFGFPGDHGSGMQGSQSFLKIFFSCTMWRGPCSPISVSGVKPAPPAVEVQSLNHWTAREVPITAF